MLAMKEGWTKNGNINRFVLGTPKTSEMVVEWSKHHKTGEQFQRSLIWGLCAVATADGTTPHIQFFLWEEMLALFLKNIAPLEGMYISGMGIAAVLHSQPGDPAEVGIILETNEEEHHVLYRFSSLSKPKLVPLGQLDLNEDGPVWREVSEMDEFNSIATARIAKPAEPPKTELPKIEKYETLPDLPEPCVTAEIDPGMAEDAEEAWTRVLRRASGRTGR
jgi:hypothetical protein